MPFIPSQPDLAPGLECPVSLGLSDAQYTQDTRLGQIPQSPPEPSKPACACPPVALAEHGFGFK
jgi:hypothetical protein